jgi:outer membrane protein assembly factor BamB
MVCSPALTADALYVTTGAGRLLCVDRKSGSVRWTFTLSADEMVFSSPSVAGGSVFVGTRGKGLFCLSERPTDALAAGPPRPWLGAGGNPNRNGAADDRGLPVVEGDPDLKWPTPEALQAPVVRPPLASGGFVYAAFENRLVRIDAATGRPVAEVAGRTYPYAAGPNHVHAWNLAEGPAPDGQGFAKFEPPTVWPVARGDFDTDPRSKRFRLRNPVFAHDLVVEALETEIECVSAAGPSLWKAKLKLPATGPPTLLDDRLFVATGEGGDYLKGFLECRRLVDGSPVWRVELNAKPVSHPVAHGDWVVIATSDDKIAAFNAADGKGIEPVVVDGKAATPALWKNTLIVAGGTRIAAYDLSTRDWAWNYKGQDDIGMVVGQPVILNETIWVGTTKKGLLAIGVPPKAAKK